MIEDAFRRIDPDQSIADVRQTSDQHLDQTLFHSPRDLAVRQDLGLCFGEATDSRVQASQPSRKSPGGL
jgi:hypothetical protein